MYNSPERLAKVQQGGAFLVIHGLEVGSRKVRVLWNEYPAAQAALKPYLRKSRSSVSQCYT